MLISQRAQGILQSSFSIKFRLFPQIPNGEMSSSIELWNIDTAYLLCIREPRVQPACLTVIDMLMETIRYGFIRSASVSKLPLSTAILSQCMRIPRQLRNLF